MDTKRAVKLAKAIHAKTGQAVCITQKIWDYGTEVKSYYQFTYFTKFDDCRVEDFSSYKALEEFARNKWDL